MATYKKRGYKPKTKEEEQNTVEDQSTTAEVFNSLDEGASKTEEWVARNQKYIYIIIGIAAVAILGYLGYQEFIMEPKESEAANEMFQAHEYFETAMERSGATSDSLYNLALSGGEGKYGFEGIIENYGGTEAANLAQYYAGMAYLNTSQYKKAVDRLEDFESDDQILAPLAKGAIGDAFMQLEQPEEALTYYEEAAQMRNNNFTTPRFLMKAAVVALQTGDGATAEEYLTRIRNEFPDSPEANKVDVYLGQAKVMQ